MDEKLLIGNEVRPGIWQADVPADQMRGESVVVRICTHDRLNDHEDACLDCGAVRVDGKWQ